MTGRVIYRDELLTVRVTIDLVSTGIYDDERSCSK